jgi:hypothetical protein
MVHMKDSKGRMPIVQFNASTIIDGSAVNRKINLLPTQCGTMAGDFQQQLRITAGRNAALGQYPWMVRLAYKSRQSGKFRKLISQMNSFHRNSLINVPRH